jgi:hypothetical protein
MKIPDLSNHIYYISHWQIVFSASDDISSYDDDYSQENSFPKGFDLSPSQKPIWKKMNSSTESGKDGRDG